VVFAHGYDSEPETYGILLHSIAAAGYLVAAPEMPGSAHALAGAPVRDIADQARDVSFVLTSLLTQQRTLIDPHRIVAAGHSDGGSAVATLALNSSYRDPRFDAYVVLSGVVPSQVTEGSWRTATATGALLVIVGAQDEYGNATASQSVFDSTTLRGALVQVPTGDHSQMYVALSDLADRVRMTIVRFLAAVLPSGGTRLSPQLLGAPQFGVRLR
jgi:dipeptidyl aminopeptidase/acylaminoacyl peptidase